MNVLLKLLKYLLTFCVIAMVLTACTSFQQGKTVNTQVPPLEEIRNGSYAGIFDQAITLVDGVWEGRPYVEGGASRPRVALVEAGVAYGELDADKGEEAAVLLSESSGGSGEHIYLTVLGNGEGGLVQRGIIFIGDRIKFRSLSIVNHQIELDVIEAVPQDPSCCPTHAVTKTYALRQGRLEAVGSAGEGGQSLSTLSGTVWTLVEMDGRPLEAGVKPPTLEFREGRVGGFSGCNRYQGGFKDSGTGSISMGQMAGTMMACPPAMMALEKNYMARLLKAKEYSFQAGGLVLSSGEGDQPSLLKFTGKPLEKQQK